MALFIPVGVIGFQDFLDSLEPDTGLPTMTLEDVVRLSDNGKNTTFAQITAYDGERSDWTSLGEIHYVVDFEEYTLTAIADKWHEELQFLELTRKGTGEKVDVINGDVREFLKNK